MLTYPPVIDRESALEFLQRRINYERTSQIPYRESEFKLDRMRYLLERLGNPQLAFPALHITGTKGKGSTATMTAAALTAAGYKTGLYTSPHLERLEERIVINGKLCTEPEFVQLAAETAEAVAELDADSRPEVQGATFFEVTTAMGFLHFARSRVDLAVLEVGLGGRLDSTNVCQPLACAITSISYDHTKQLGDSLAEIAAEKAGIAKRGVPLVCAVTEPEPQQIIHQIAAAAGAKVVQVHADYGYSSGAGKSVKYWDSFHQEPFQMEGLELAMPGRHQASNAACAIALLRQLKDTAWRVPESAIRLGLRAARCPARVEIIRRNPLVVMDAAHNVASVAALLQALDELEPHADSLLIFGTTRDKDVAGMLKLLVPHFQRIIFTRYVNNPRAVEPDALASMANDLLADKSRPVIETCDTPAQAWQRASELQASCRLTCITGSFFLAAELRPLIGS